MIAAVAEKIGAKVIVFSNNLHGKAIAPRLSARLKAGLVAGAVDLPDTANGFVVKKNVFSGKAFAKVAVNTDVKIIFLHTVCQNCDVFRSILIIFRELLNINKSYIKAQVAY